MIKMRTWWHEGLVIVLTEYTYLAFL